MNMSYQSCGVLFQSHGAACLGAIAGLVSMFSASGQAPLVEVNLLEATERAVGGGPAQQF